MWREGERISVSCKWEEKETPEDPLGVKGGGRMCLLSSVVRGDVRHQSISAHRLRSLACLC